MPGVSAISRSPANLEIYDNPRVASHYASLKYLTSCERMLIDRHVPRGAAVLDLGVGGGRTTTYLSALAGRYVGVDYSTEMISACRAKFPRLTFLQANAADLSMLEDSSFDVICFSFNGLDYLAPLENRQKCLLECNRLLRMDGKFIFSSHNPRAVVVRSEWSARRVRAFSRKLVGRRSLFYNLIVSATTVAKGISSSLQALTATCKRICCRATQGAFFTGEGFMMDSIHGGLTTHYCTPDRAISQCREFGFECVQVTGDDYPRPSWLYSTDWYYYVCTKVTECYQKVAVCA
jgi:ubiquinone/menaquinone biosynthesis C-methylase UbiE